MFSKIIYKIKLLLYKLLNKDPNNLNIEYYRKKGCTIGKNNRIFSNICPAEPYLLTIKDNVTISVNVMPLIVVKCHIVKNDKTF